MQISIEESITEGFKQAIRTTELSLITILADTSSSSLEDLFLKVIEPWQKDRSYVFDFKDGTAYYNIAVYIKEDESLILKARLCDDRITRRDRVWNIGEGHVGSCFVRRELVVMEDISSLSLTDKSKELYSDREFYRSFMGYPLRHMEQMVGVLVVTSSKPGQFNDIIHGARLALLARTIEICLHLKWS